MRVPFYQVDAFSRQPLGGNPAAICVLPGWPSEILLGRVAEENNLSETAFVVPRGDGSFDLRWFTPTVEVDLCGHATLAAAFVLFRRRDARGDVQFHTRSGVLSVTETENGLVMDFPVVPVIARLGDERELRAALGNPRELWSVREVHYARYVLAVVKDEAAVRAAAPDVSALRALGVNAIITARGTDTDVVSRFFAPASGVDEDPVTGSAHATLAPFWTPRVGKRSLSYRQLSRRGGELWTTLDDDRVKITGHAALFLEGEAVLPG